MKVLVTGGAGFIGSHVVDALIEAGHEIAVVDNLWEHGGGRKENIHPRARRDILDIRDPRLWQIFEDVRPKVVYHLAAQHSVKMSTDWPLLDSEVNIGGLINLLENCVQYGIRKVVFASTSAVYGTVPSFQMPIDENTPMNPPESPYGVTKLAGEHYLRVWKVMHGLDYTILRYGNVYGPRQDPSGEAGVIGIFADRILRGEPVRIDWDGEQSKDYVYVEDVARANLLALERGDSETYCIGRGKNISVNEIYRALTELIGTEVEARHAPKRPGDVRLFQYDCGKAERELGWKAEVSLEEGLRRTVEYYRERNTA